MLTTNSLVIALVGAVIVLALVIAFARKSKTPTSTITPAPPTAPAITTNAAGVSFVELTPEVQKTLSDAAAKKVFDGLVKDHRLGF